MNISTAVDGENLELHGKEMQNKNKNKHKVTKVPTAKLIEIAVANCNKWSQFRDRIDVLCTKALPIFPDWTLYEIGNLLARFSYDHATRDRKRRKIFVISITNSSKNKR